MLGSGNGTFQTAPSYPSGVSPDYVTTGDLDGDGNADLAVANMPTNDVYVLLGNGNGTFQAAVNYPAGTSPASLAIADLNGDGALDLVVANWTTNHVSILLGNGNGTFQAPVSYPSGAETASVAIGDLSGDGVQDLAVVNPTYAGQASILLGNGDGTFQTAVNYPAGSHPSSVAIADLNGDGAQDLSVTNRIYDGQVSILLGNGDGTFQAAASYPAGAYPSSVAIADLNGNGVLDLGVVASLEVSILLGNGDGTFQTAVNYPAGSYPSSVAIADLNGDGALDLTVVKESDEVSILLGNGNATFRPWISYITGDLPVSVAVAEFNNDGKPDLAVANLDAGDVAILLQESVSCPSAVNFLVGQGLAAQNGNEVKLFDAAGNPTAVSFLAYGAGQWGVNVAAAFLTAGAGASILTGPGPGAVYGPHVRGFVRTGAVMPTVSFYAYGTLRYGVSVSGGGMDADPFGEILTGAGPGDVFGPHVRGFDCDGGAIAPIAGINFFAYKTLKFGVNVASGDLDGDGYQEILTGPGPGVSFGPHVRGFNYDGGSISGISRINFNAFSQGSHGAVVAGGDVDADGFAEIAVSPGPGPGNGSRFVGYNYDGGKVTWLAGFDVAPYGTRYGGRVFVNDLDADARADLITGPGPDTAAPALVQSFAYDGQALTKRPGSFTAFTSMYGVNVAAGSFGW